MVYSPVAMPDIMFLWAPRLGQCDQEIHRVVRRRAVGTQPCDGSLGLSEYSVHETDLRFSLLEIGLVDAYRIDPKVYFACKVGVVAQLVQ